MKAILLLYAMHLTFLKICEINLEIINNIGFAKEFLAQVRQTI